MKHVLALGIVLLTACAASPAQRARTAAADADVNRRLEQRLAGYRAGPSVDCLSPTLTRDAGTEAYGRVILYKTAPGLVYRNDTTGGCESLAHDSYIVTVSPSGRLCRGDIARTIDRGSRVENGSCALGSFTPYRR